jgi:hypothetical protein
MEVLPEYRQVIEAADNPMSMWIDLRLAWERIDHDANPKLEVRFLTLARWCLSDASGQLPNDTSTAAAVAFIEHLPQRREHWAKFRKWFTKDEFLRLRPHFGYFLSESELAELTEQYERGKP